MNFRQVLARLHQAKASGITRFDSVYLAGICGISVGQASKYLGRLYRMGFLTRTKCKRTCITETKFCYKGYCYEYTLSTQGVRYVQWMTSSMPIEAISYSKLYSEVAPYLPDDVRNSIDSSIIVRMEMKYKGPNRSLQNLGVLTLAIPAITKRLKETESQRDQLETSLMLSGKNLSKEVSRNKELEEKFRNLENQNSSLRQEFDNKVRQMNHLGLRLAQRLIMQAEADHEYIGALRIDDLINDKIARDLGGLLVASIPDQEAALKVIEIICRRYDRERMEVKERLAKAKEAQEAAQSVK